MIVGEHLGSGFPVMPFKGIAVGGGPYGENPANGGPIIVPPTKMIFLHKFVSHLNKNLKINLKKKTVWENLKEEEKKFFFGFYASVIYKTFSYIMPTTKKVTLLWTKNVKKQ